MYDDIKTELHQLVDQCANEHLLEEAKALLESSEIKDWWKDAVDSGEATAQPETGSSPLPAAQRGQ